MSKPRVLSHAVPSMEQPEESNAKAHPFAQIPKLVLSPDAGSIQHISYLPKFLPAAISRATSSDRSTKMYRLPARGRDTRRSFFPIAVHIDHLLSSRRR